jgi:hypothetical protein
MFYKVGWRGGDVTAVVLPTRSVCGAIVSSQMGDHEFWGIGVVLGLEVFIGARYLPDFGAG